MDLVVVCADIETNEIPIVSDHPVARAIRRFVIELGVPDCGIAFWSHGELVPQYRRKPLSDRRLVTALESVTRVVVVGDHDRARQASETLARFTNSLEVLPNSDPVAILACYQRYPVRPRPLERRGRPVAVLAGNFAEKRAENALTIRHALDERVAAFDDHRVVSAADGYLATLEQSSTLVPRLIGFTNAFYALPLRVYFPLLETRLVFGDNGAFGVWSKPEPVLTPREVAYLYHVLGVDVGFALDHIPHASLSYTERKRRVALSVELAQQFREAARPYRFVTIVVAHGASPPEVAHTLQLYRELGFEFVAIPTPQIRSERYLLSFFRTYKSLLQSFEWVHALGMTGHRVAVLGIDDVVDSFDSTAPMTEALWGIFSQSSRCESLTVFCPEVDGDQVVLDALLAYERHELDLDSTVEIVLRYDRLFRQLKGLRDLCDPMMLPQAIRRTLASRFWETCECAACREAGIAVAIHRSRRYGFARAIHNIHLELKPLARASGNSRAAQLFLL